MSPEMAQETGDLFKASPHLAECRGGRGTAAQVGTLPEPSPP